MKKTLLISTIFLALTLVLAACGPASTPAPTVTATDAPPIPTTLPSEEATPASDNDFSGLTYTDAFERLFARARRDYAFNGVDGKQPDWDALYASIAPRVQQAEAENDKQAWFLALRDFTLAFQDGRVNLGGGDVQVQLFQTAIAGGYGFAIRQLDDGRYLVTHISAGGPAEGAGMRLGAEVTAFNGDPLPAAMEAVSIWGAPPSSESLLRYQQSRYLLRAPLGTKASVTFTNPGAQPQTVTLTAAAESESFAASSIFRGYDTHTLPVEYKILPSGAGLVRVTNTSGQGQAAALFEKALVDLQAAQVRALVIDLRMVVNLASDPLTPMPGLAGFFSDKEIFLGQVQFFDAASGQFVTRGGALTVFPKPNQYHFEKIAVLVGPGCSNSCELEAYALSQLPGVQVVGESPTAGTLSDVTGGQFLLPEGFSFQFPLGRVVSSDGAILLEGQGLSPSVRVPVDAATVLSSEDVVLNAAQAVVTGE